MHEVLRQALAPVLRDIAATEAPLPDIRDEPWAGDPRFASVTLWSRNGSGMGVSVALTKPEPERVARVADQVQEWVVEELWRRAATNWPVCPRHPYNHPLQAVVRDAVAVWVCPTDTLSVSAIGALG